MSFVGGKLKLKGGVPGKSGKKKKKAPPVDALVPVAQHEATEEQPEQERDTRTEAEKKFEAKMMAAEEKRLAKLAAVSHRDRVREFNEKLEALSEHHDIPKVGPG